MMQYVAASHMIAYYKDFCWAQFPQKLILPSVSVKSRIFFWKASSYSHAASNGDL